MMGVLTQPVFDTFFLTFSNHTIYRAETHKNRPKTPSPHHGPTHRKFNPRPVDRLNFIYMRGSFFDQYHPYLRFFGKCIMALQNPHHPLLESTALAVVGSVCRVCSGQPSGRRHGFGPSQERRTFETAFRNGNFFSSFKFSLRPHPQNKSSRSAQYTQT